MERYHQRHPHRIDSLTHRIWSNVKRKWRANRSPFFYFILKRVTRVT